MEPQSSFKNVLGLIFQWLGAALGFVISLAAANLLLPLSRSITDATPPSGFLSMPMAMLLNGVVNATILVWTGRRSSFRGPAVFGQLLLLSSGTQIFMTQIETGYFLSAFPLLHGNFELYRLILRGFVTSLLFTALVTLLVGGFSHRAAGKTKFTVDLDHAVKSTAWLAAVYFILYALFGYYVAWQSQELRLFYGGSAELNSFVDQWGATLMARPELPVFQYFRGILWTLCLMPLFKGFTGKRLELVILSALALAYLPTVQLAFPNPLMPPNVSYFHFWEVSISTGIFGALCAWVIPKEVDVASKLG